MTKPQDTRISETLSNLPPETQKKAEEIARSCYSMGTVGTIADTLFSPEKHQDGTYRNPMTAEGRGRIRDACFDELAAPVIRNNGGGEKDVENIRDHAIHQSRAR